MPSLLNTDQTNLDRRVRSALASGRTRDGEPLFPDVDTPGTPGYNLRRIIVMLLQQERREANALLQEFSWRTASIAGIRDWLTNFGLVPGVATRARGDLRITSEVTGKTLESLFGGRRIPLGTRVSGPGITLVTTDDVEIPLDEKGVTVEVEHPTPGTGTRVTAGTRLRVEAGGLEDVLTGETITDVTGGQAAENEQQMRFRLSRAMTNPSTHEGFLARLLGHEDVSESQIEEAKYGPGTIEAFVVPALAYPPQSLRVELESLWIGPGRVYVTFPSYEGLALHVRTDRDVPLAGVVDYVNNLGLGDTVVVSQIERALLEAGAGDAQVIGLKRGPVDQDGYLTDPRRVAQITNLTSNGGRHKWYVRQDWITLCR